MFGKSSKSRVAAIDTIVGAQTRLEGDVHFSGGLHVDGAIKGNITAEPGSEAVLTVSERGSVEGEVRVPNLVLNGTVVGDVYASERVELASHARVTGNVYYKLIEMAMGAEVNGNLVHKAEQQKQPEAKPKVVTVDEPGMQTAK